MSNCKRIYEKPAIVKNGNIREITLNHAGWTCSVDGSSSNYSDYEGHHDHHRRRRH